MEKHILHIGTRHRHTKRHIGSRRKCNRIIIRVLASFGIDGLTIYSVDGIYKGVTERTQVIEIYHDNEQAIREVAIMLTILLHQDEIYHNGVPVKYPEEH